MFELTSQYKSGIIKLAALIGLLCFFVMGSNFLPKTEPSFILDEEAQCFLDNQELILEDEAEKNKYTYYVNSISDYQGYQLGLSVSEIDKFLAFRNKGGKIYSLIQFKKITGIGQLKLDSIKSQLVFPRSKIKHISAEELKNRKVIKYDLNKVTSAQLYSKLKLPSMIANRVIKFRKYINGYRSMEQLTDVYDITENHLELINKYCKILNVNYEMINVKESSKKELSKVPYLNYKQSGQIIKYLKNHPEIKSLSELKQIQGFEKVNIARLPLYLTID